MPRIFVALPLPRTVASDLARALPDLPGLRRVAPELMHVTLAFLGQTEEVRVADVTAAAESAAAAFGPIPIELDALGRFPAHGRPSTVWAGMSAPAADRVVRLGGAVRAELLRRQVRFDAKPLRAHVTLARVRDGASDDEARAIAAAVTAARLDGLAFRAEEVQVVESTLSSRVPPGGSRVPPGGSTAPLYSSRARIPLAGPSR